MKKNIILISILFVICACENSLYNKMKEIPDAKWDMNSPIKFDVQVDDTLGLWDFFVLIRHNTDYEWSNLFTFITTTMPDNTIKADTIEFILALPDGRWVGNGSGFLRTDDILINTKFRFPQKGLYSFEFQQAMRDSILNGITEVGIRIKPSKL